MIPAHNPKCLLIIRIPRESGDDPAGVEDALCAVEYSPRERG